MSGQSSLSSDQYQKRRISSTGLLYRFFEGFFLYCSRLHSRAAKNSTTPILATSDGWNCHADLQPAGRPVVSDTHMGDQHSDQQQDGDAQDKYGNAAQALIVEFWRRNT